MPTPAGPSGDPAVYRDPSHGRALGSIGSGNHFAEITRVSEVRDEAAADAMGLEKGSLVALAHTGSRGLGAQIGRRYGDVVLTGEAIAVYLADLAGAVRFAQANRFLVACRLLRALSALRRDKVRGAIAHRVGRASPTVETNPSSRELLRKFLRDCARHRSCLSQSADRLP